MMRDGRIKIMRGRCPKLMNEIKTYAYGADGKIIGGNDHLLDSMRYLIMGLKYAQVKNNLIVPEFNRTSGASIF